MEQYTYDILYREEETHWWFVGRRAVILEQIAHFYQGQTTLSVLDIGCGTGIFLKSLVSYGNIVGLDLSRDALQFCQQRQLAQLVQGDGVRLPFADHAFDVLTANDFLEHVDDDVTSLREFFRVLKPEGRLFIFVPAYQFLWSLQDEISHHKRRYTMRQLTQAISSAGFKPEYLTYANMLLFPVIFAGRQALKVLRCFRKIDTENTLHPHWTNRWLKHIFLWEVVLLRRIRFPVGVSIMAVCRKS